MGKRSFLVLAALAGCASSHTPHECEVSSACSIAAPRCSPDTLTCVACVGDVDCTGYAMTPHCGASGACVACAASNQCANPTPVCDPTAQTCRVCASDGECDSEVCDLDTGTCVDQGSILYAVPGGTATAGCTKADPCGLGRAFDVAVSDLTRNHVKLEPGTYTSTATLLLGGEMVDLTIHGAGAMMDTSMEVGDGAAMRIRDLAFTVTATLDCEPTAAGSAMPTLDLERVSWADGAAEITAKACQLQLRQVHLRDSDNNAVLIQADGEVAGVNGATANRGSTVVIDRSWLEGAAPAISLFHYSSVEVTNSVFTSQNPLYGPVQLDATTVSSSISFSTIYNSPLKCPTGAIQLTSNNNIYVNTAAGAPADTVTGTACNHSFDLISPQTTVPTGGASNMRNMDPKFVDPASGDFHLQSGSPAIDAADSSATDPIDYDGTMRPQGTRRDLGAFERQP